MSSRTLRLPVITTIEYKGINLIIMDSPTKSSVPYFVEECSRLHVSDIVRVCEDRYPTDEFERSGIRVHVIRRTPEGLQISDVQISLSENFVSLECSGNIVVIFEKEREAQALLEKLTKESTPSHWEFSDGSPPPDNVLSDWFNLLRARFYTEPKTASSNSTGAAGPVAVHCIAGYGRAPVLVAVALMELGMPCADAIELIRSKRKGAFNDRQLAYLTAYHPKSRLRRHGNRCFLM